MKKLLLALLLATTPVAAQTVQPTYTRPSKGAAVTILSTSAAVTSTVTYSPSALFDWTAFAGVIVTVNAPTPPPASACRYGIRVRALGGTSTNKSDFFLLNVANSDYRASTSQAWYVRVLPGYLYFQMESYEANASGAVCSGTTKVTITPLPIDYSGQLVSTGVVGAVEQSSMDPFALAVVTFSSSLPYTRIQNFSTSATRCTPVLEDGTIPSTSNDWPIRLAAASADGAGDGGVIEVSNWVGTMKCDGRIGIFQH